MDLRYAIPTVHNNLEYHSFIEESNETHIHFYTVVYTNMPHTLNIYWYHTHKEEFDLFEDFQHILQKMKEFKLCTIYTGDIFSIINDCDFYERLLLLGIEKTKDYSLHLKNDADHILSGGVTNDIPIFNELFDICFQHHHRCQSFLSSDAKTRMSLFDKKEDAFFSSPQSDIFAKEYCETPLLLFNFLDNIFITNYISTHKVSYSYVSSIVHNSILNDWFRILIHNQQYSKAVETILKIQRCHDMNSYIKELNTVVYSENLSKTVTNGLVK